MNKTKSIFIAVFPMYAMLAAGLGAYMLTVPGDNVIWLGVVMVTLPVMMFIGRVMIFQDVARTSAHFPLLTVLALAGVGTSLAGYETAAHTDLSGLALGMSIAGFVFYLLYTFWYSSLGRGANHRLAVGLKLPDFTVTDTQNRTVTANDFHGTPAVLMFYRGNWCPLCMAQIKEVASKYRELSELGVKVALISPQPHKNTRALSAKFKVPFLFLTDKRNQAARALNIEMKHGLPAGMEMLGYDKDTVYPTVIIIDAESRIIYNDLTNNYRIRPDPGAYIEVLKHHVQVPAGASRR